MSNNVQNVKKLLRISLLFFTVVFIVSYGFTTVSPIKSDAAELVIMLDPGHGGSDPGAQNTVDGILYQEKTLNLKIARGVKNYLSQFSGVKVLMTREDDNTYLTLGQRVSIANKMGAHTLVSIHNNSSGEPTASGTLIIVADNKFRPDISTQTKEMSNKILSHMSALGLRNRGLMTKMADSGSYVVYYPDGSPQDYYGIVQRSVRAGIPGIIIESAFISSPDDVRKYLSSDEKLSAMGAAIGKGIAEYYGLSSDKTYDTSYRQPIDAKNLDMTKKYNADLVYALGNSSKTYAEDSGVTISSANSAPCAYLDYMGMTLQTEEYSAAVITAKASYNDATMSIYYGSDEVYTVNENYQYSTKLSDSYRRYVIDFSSSPIWNLGVNFLQLNVKGCENFSIKNIEFFANKSSIPYDDVVYINSGSGSISTPTPTPKPTPAPTATPTPKPTPAPTATPTPKPTATPSPKPTATPTIAPTAAPTSAPTPVETEEITTIPATESTEISTETITSAPVNTDNHNDQQVSIDVSEEDQDGGKTILVITLICTIAAAVGVAVALFILNRNKNN